MANRHYIVIAGCGRLGALLANLLSGQGHSVVVIDQDAAAFAQLSMEFSGFQIVGDAAELSVLREANVDQADFFITTTDQDNVNLMLAQIAKVLFQVPIVIARLFDPSREAIYRELGITTICPTKLSVDAFFQAIQAGPEGAPR